VSYYSLKTEQKLPISMHEAWDFFSSPKNLSKITPKHMGFTITNKPSETMFEGQIITYKVSPLFGIKINWMTEITTVKNHEYFIDEQRFGPYSLWHHRHHFSEIEGGVKMTDEVNYKLPFGIIGSIAHRIFIKNKLKSIFEYREKVLIDIFGQF
jgi:ligand-binding SRPBCC domain-containing protein|tara:strand:- start:11812 stop:12273 length:462 start_codon:yes stop_codon:yes gene_type:complete